MAHYRGSMTVTRVAVYEWEFEAATEAEAWDIATEATPDDEGVQEVEHETTDWDVSLKRIQED